MTKQEEIRTEIKAYLAEAMDGIEFTEDDEKGLDVMTENLLEYLHSQGVAIKMDRELPYATEETVFGRLTWPVELMDPAHGTYIEVYRLAQQDMGEAGYVAVEPLIK